MREIKFRAWDKKEKKMLFWEYLLIKQTKFVNSKYFVAMQYTGLKDKNGKEIYEMDIVDYFGKKILVTIPDIYIENYKNLNLEDCKVIGNKFENPELLDDKK